MKNQLEKITYVVLYNLHKQSHTILYDTPAPGLIDYYNIKEKVYGPFAHVELVKLKEEYIKKDYLKKGYTIISKSLRKDEHEIILSLEKILVPKEEVFKQGEKYKYKKAFIIIH